MLAEEEFSTFETQKKVLMEPLVATFLDIIKTGESAIISDSSYLEALGLSSGRFSATEIWKQIIQKSFKRKQFLSANFSRPLEIILNEGTLSSRILRNAGPDPSRAVIRDIYHKMCDCLSDGIMFL
jgi:carboxylate-amine ligase